ncbi:MAG TPA: pyridoxamine 5'-phosphate oxidase family protein [Anaerovoracaceae bacterium]|nr:pyridoxamine 5'-phosphate oxidase family protein [Anaerovoracaceae bacterium]
MRRTLRRSDLAMADEETLSLIKSCRFAVLSLVDPDGLPYGVPLDYICKDNNLYFHGAKEGRKIDSMKMHPKGCVVILGETIVVSEKFGRKYTSAIIEGPIELIDDPEIKRQVMTWVVESNSPDHKEKGKAIIEKMLDRVLIYKMNMETVSGKHGI